MSTIRVHTAQNVTLEYEVAGLGDRIVATIIDYVVLGAWVFAWMMVPAALAISGRHSSSQLSGVAMILVFVVAYAPLLFYNLVCEVFFNGQSIGKKAMNIKVMRLDGTAPRIGDYLLRWLLRIIDLQFAGLVAIITIAANGRGQRLGDLAAGTTVLKLRPRTQYRSPLAEAGPVAGYQVVFPEAALLADHDVALVRQLMQQASARQNYQLLNELANKVKSITGIRTDLQDAPFLQTILRDHAHLATS
ncbi:RDD family protein [Hymenobacter sp. BT770]|uniref:RDD family protein n=1 Tax=Hymenobacter sp. BT770 TaxID=2886942 RepID=UPI001D0FDD83|nr:RDD family protein [Hymenobacter sp. BT770]MCC3152692.1 RDD family protein [Hymenobacter sp. BT770]MDO3414765.1 RDD family protein [Hymenobacter sp. BT770]